MSSEQSHTGRVNGPAVESAAQSGSQVDVGKQLRILREQRNLTIRALAARSGLAVNTLSLIENGRTSPSVSTLQQLAQALEAPITAFFAVEQPRRRIIHQLAAERRGAVFAYGSIDDLGAGMAQRAIEPMLVVLNPYAGSGSEPIVHTGQEFVYCLEGRIVYTIAEQVYLLHPGDSLLFEAHQPHRWHNPEAVPARALLIICPFDGRDNPLERHFAPA